MGRELEVDCISKHATHRKYKSMTLWYHHANLSHDSLQKCENARALTQIQISTAISRIKQTNPGSEDTPGRQLSTACQQSNA